MGFPGGSTGKESTYNVGDLGSIPGLKRSSGERIYMWVSLIAQLVKNSPAMQETPLGFLDREDPLENG